MILSGTFVSITAHSMRLHYLLTTLFLAAMIFIDNFGNATVTVHFISVDGKAGFHQISVNEADQEKLAFFGLDIENYCFTVMPFGPRNAPSIYTAIMKILKDEWDLLFRSRYPDLFTKDSNNNIIDDTLLWSPDQMITLQYFCCVCEIIKKYRLSFCP
jgi:hypothetical protein